MAFFADVLSFLTGLFLLQLPILSVLSSLIYGAFLTVRPPSFLRTAFKTASLSLLVPVAMVLTHGQAGSLLLCLALAASTLGDWLLAAQGEKRFVAGVGAFAVAHAAYIPLFVTLGAWATAPSVGQVVGMFALVSAASVLLFKVLWPHLGALRWPLTGYFLIILAMGITALALPQGSEGAILILIGAGLFILSDMVLGIELFRLKDGDQKKALTSRVIWFSYYGGQVLIAFGVAAYWWDALF